jgi:hypothetical protein
LKEDLELREQEAKFQEVFDKKTSEEKLQKEIERLRKEGSRQLEVTMMPVFPRILLFKYPDLYRYPYLYTGRYRYRYCK